MSDDEGPDYMAALEEMNEQLDRLETALEPLLGSTLSDTLNRTDKPLERAKMSALLGYLVHDLVWMYLRTKGLDPATHPVTAELARIKDYFDKIRAAGEKLSDPHFEPAPPNEIARPKHAGSLDTAAAERFIRAGIDPAAKREQRTKHESANIEATRRRLAQREQVSDVGQHTRFKAFATQEEAPDAKKTDTDDPEEPEVELEVNVARDPAPVDEPAKKKRKKARTDPLVGYDDAAAAKAAQVERKRLKKLAKAERKLGAQAAAEM